MNITKKTVLFVSTTKRNDLCCVSASINPKKKHDPSAKSDFHWQILRCRQIIFEYNEIIAAPATDNQIQINMIMKKEFYRTGTLKAFLELLDMPVLQVQQLTNEIYESCLRYTIIAHIAPQWNQLQNYLLQGRNFLVTNESLPAVHLEVEVKANSIYVVINPLKVRVHGFTIEDLDIPQTLSDEFKSKKKMSIHDINIGAIWVHVLPSMKRGRIITISHDIPNSCPYKTYKELRRHWKNSYGYRLPESDDGIFYCTLSFHPMIPTKYTYPSICLKTAPLQFLGGLDERKVMAQFLTDLAKKMPNACETPFKVNGEQGYAIPQNTEQMKYIQTSATPLELHTGLLPKPIYGSPGQGILSIRDMNRSNSQGEGNIASTQRLCDARQTTPLANGVINDPGCSSQNNLLWSGKNSFQTLPKVEVAQIPGSSMDRSISSSISAVLESNQRHVSKAKHLVKNATMKIVENPTIDRNTLKQSPQRVMAANMARYSQPFADSAFASNASQLAITPRKINTEIIESARGDHTFMSQPGTFTSYGAHPTHPFQSQNLRQASSQQALPGPQQSIQQASKQRICTPTFPVTSVDHGAMPTEAKTIIPKKYVPVFAPPAIPCSQRVPKRKSVAKPKTSSKCRNLGSAQSK